MTPALRIWVSAHPKAEDQIVRVTTPHGTILLPRTEFSFIISRPGKCSRDGEVIVPPFVAALPEADDPCPA